jgi:hypothetical protein
MRERARTLHGSVTLPKCYVLGRPIFGESSGLSLLYSKLKWKTEYEKQLAIDVCFNYFKI